MSDQYLRIVGECSNLPQDSIQKGIMKKNETQYSWCQACSLCFSVTRNMYINNLPRFKIPHGKKIISPLELSAN